jgi:hypothetical protein
LETLFKEQYGHSKDIISLHVTFDEHRTVKEPSFREHEDSIVLNLLKNMNEQLSTIGRNDYHDNDDGGLSYDELGKFHSQ